MEDLNELKKGMVSQDLFLELCKKGGKEKEAMTLRKYLFALGLAVELKDGQMFIPALVSDENEVRLRNLMHYLLTLFSQAPLESGFNHDFEVSISFSKNIFSIGTFEKFCSHLIRRCSELGQENCFHEIFYQKIGKI